MDRAAGAAGLVALAVLLVTAAPVECVQAHVPLSPLAVRTRLSDRGDADAVREAVSAASERLAQRSCRELLTVYTDRDGRPLQSRLDSLGIGASAYMGLIGFHDGRIDRRCRSGRILAFTAPGSRNVFVCPGFARMHRRKPAMAEVIMLHEALHSLGLGENPPSSAEITATVTARCSAPARSARSAR